MSDEDIEKSDLEKSRDIISQLKEMQHYCVSNIEHLTEIWLLLDGELKQKTVAKQLENLISEQNKFHDLLEPVISDFEIECNRIENEDE